MQLDRRKEFFDVDDPTLEISSFLATIFRGTNGRSVGQNRMAAASVRERGTKTFCNMLRFICTVTPRIQNTLNIWIAVVKLSVDLTNSLFFRSRLFTEECQAMKESVDNFIRTTSVAISVSRRSADCFVLLQFHITCTNARTLLLANAAVWATLGLNQSTTSERIGLEQWFDIFYSGSFYAKVATEAVMRVNSTKEPVICALRSKSYVKEVFDVGIIAAKRDGYLALSPDVIALFYESSFEDWNVYVQGTLQFGIEELFLAVVEIKSWSGASTVG